MCEFLPKKDKYRVNRSECMNLAETYKKAVMDIINRVWNEERENMELASDLIVKTILDNKLIYVFGTGHSMLLAMEMFTRSGGLVQVYPMLDLSISGYNGALKATYIERLSGYAKALLDYYGPEPGSTLIIVSNSGKNAVPVEMAFEAKKRGIKIIALTSRAYSNKVPASNPLKKRLYEIADIVIDNKIPLADTAVYVEELKQGIGPASTIVNSFILHWIEAWVVEKLLAKGVKPMVWKEGNVPGGDEFNKLYYDKYFDKIKPL